MKILLIRSIWDRLFLEERSSLSLSFFRLAVAFTVGSVVIPTFFHMGDNYFATAFKSLNANFFPIEILELVQQSPQWVIMAFVGIFIISWAFFFVGFLSQFSCIVMTFACYYFYALNAFHVGTLTWDILLVTLFLMCLTPYHGDYFSVDALIQGKPDSYQTKRPYFLQRLLQLQIGFTYFYTALYKVTAQGNWLSDNPIFYIMNYPPSGTTKLFLLRDYLRTQPELCYVVGLAIILIEFLMVYLLFNSKTRLSAIYLGIVFHITLMLTLDVPATFFFLFIPQLLLFIHPQKIIDWIEQKRQINQANKTSQLIYDGKCNFCLVSVEKLKLMDLFATLQFVDVHAVDDIKKLHPNLTKSLAMSQLHLIEPDGRLYGGFDVFRRICFNMPMLYPLIPVFYFPGMGFFGPLAYRFIAKNRYLFHLKPVCKNNACFRK